MSVSRGTSRKLIAAERDAWLRENRGRLERESANAIALELRQLRFYSEKTGITDIRCSLRRRCSKLRIPFKDSFITR